MLGSLDNRSPAFLFNVSHDDIQKKTQAKVFRKTSIETAVFIGMRVDKIVSRGVRITGALSFVRFVSIQTENGAFVQRR